MIILFRSAVVTDLPFVDPFGDSRETSVLKVMEYRLHWLSWSVNRRNHADDYFVEELQGEIMDAI